MRTARKTTGTDWCPPTREIANSELIKLVGETRRAATETPSPEIEIVRDRPKKDSVVLLTKRVESSAPMPAEPPVEKGWFGDSAPVVLAEASQPLAIEIASASRFKVESLPPPRARTSKPVYPVHRASAWVTLARFVWALTVLATAVGGGMYLAQL